MATRSHIGNGLRDVRLSLEIGENQEASRGREVRNHGCQVIPEEWWLPRNIQQKRKVEREEDKERTEKEEWKKERGL